MRSIRRCLLGACLLLLLPLFACAPSDKKAAATRNAIEAAVRVFLERLATAYEKGEAKLLEGAATGREVTGLWRRLVNLAGEGRRLSPTLKEAVFEEVNPYDATNATVRTVERWDLRVLPADSGTVLSESIDQTNRVAYQLVRDRGQWLVMFRQPQQAVE